MRSTFDAYLLAIRDSYCPPNAIVGAAAIAGLADGNRGI
jgi:hypothetical protein